MSQCRSCGAEIIWCKTESGKATPLDAVPVDATKVDRTCILDNGVARFGAIDCRHDEPHYVSHFSTCLNGARHRKPKENSQPEKVR
jgi:hypothetical protein